MSDLHGPFDFGKFIPGFDFLQSMAASGQGAAGPVSALQHWVAPTVNVEELDKRITDLKAVLFWLEQNGTALKATIQALEVQKMTLATLAGMNLSMAEVAKAFTLPPQGAPTAAPVAAAAPEHWPFATAPAPQPAATPAPAAPEPAPVPEVAAQPDVPAREAAASQAAAPARQRKPAAAPAPAAAGMADPMQWWGALTQQFQQIAANALRDAPAAMAAFADAGAAAAEASAVDSKATKKQPAAKSPAKKAAKKTAASAGRKAPAKKATAKKATTKKAVTKKAAAKKAPAESAPAPAAATDWPLPPPFKFGR